MIARLWHGITPAAKADAYVAYVAKTGLADYRQTPGNQGAFLFRRIEGEEAHFVTVSLWDSMASIERFAGKDVSRAKYYPEDKEYLLAFEPNVVHYDVFSS